MPQKVEQAIVKVMMVVCRLPVFLLMGYSLRSFRCGMRMGGTLMQYNQ